MIIKMSDVLSGDGEILAGAVNGRKALAKMTGQISEEPSGPQELFLDFRDVRVATASFLRESVFAFRDLVRHRRSNFYPVIANAAQSVEEELKILLENDNSVLMLCSLDRQAKPQNPRLLGRLDPKQRLTFDLVQRGITDAGQLMRENGKSENVKQTAWNNRLAALSTLGLVIEINEGRAKKYRPLFEEA